ncbi:hypothetical protein DL93DRAFT_2113798 [Clavulina sp. PMI_390]|nr:hypothetical protein DL93DRAFT_2113798 [Clavulina sp. PMI_390]
MPAATREERKKCWEARDAYYSCLDAAGVVKPGSETSRQCRAESKTFEKNCAKSWIEYFNQRRVLAEQQKDILAEAKRQHDEASAAAIRARS